HVTGVQTCALPISPHRPAYYTKPAGHGRGLCSCQGVERMDPLSWALFALAAAAAFAVVYHLYRHREMPGQGRLLLAGMRWAALAILILLLFDPELPAPGLAAGGARTWVLVDASLSMALPVEAGDTTTRWARATAEAARLARCGGEVLLFGGSPERVAV